MCIACSVFKQTKHLKKAKSKGKGNGLTTLVLKKLKKTTRCQKHKATQQIVIHIHFSLNYPVDEQLDVTELCDCKDDGY